MTARIRSYPALAEHADRRVPARRWAAARARSGRSFAGACGRLAVMIWLAGPVGLAGVMEVGAALAAGVCVDSHGRRPEGYFARNAGLLVLAYVAFSCCSGRCSSGVGGVQRHRPAAQPHRR
jgi:hypothetical protein